MKKLIVSAMVAALLAVMFASPVTATDYDPHKPPWAYLMQAGNEDSGDDDPLGVDKTGDQRILVPFDLRWGGLIVIGIIVSFDWGSTNGSQNPDESLGNPAVTDGR